MLRRAGIGLSPCLVWRLKLPRLCFDTEIGLLNEEVLAAHLAGDELLNEGIRTVLLSLNRLSCRAEHRGSLILIIPVCVHPDNNRMLALRYYTVIGGENPANLRGLC